MVVVVAVDPSREWPKLLQPLSGEPEMHGSLLSATFYGHQQTRRLSLEGKQHCRQAPTGGDVDDDDDDDDHNGGAGMEFGSRDRTL